MPYEKCAQRSRGEEELRILVFSVPLWTPAKRVVHALPESGYTRMGIDDDRDEDLIKCIGIWRENGDSMI
jgi:hypothetical protein